MDADEILKHKRLSLFEEKILCDLKGVYYISLFDAADVLEIKKSNAYKLLKTNANLLKTKVFVWKEIGGAKFVTLESVVDLLEEREKKKEIVAFRKASMINSTGIAPAKLVKDLLKQLSPEEKQKALNEIFSSFDFQNFVQNQKDKPSK